MNIREAYNAFNIQWANQGKKHYFHEVLGSPSNVFFSTNAYFVNGNT